MAVGPHVAAFDSVRPQLAGVAYRMLGSVSDTEDVLQDVYLRWQRQRLREVQNPAAFLTSMVSRVCIDRLRRRKVEKLNYVGPWLPEPLLTGPEIDPGEVLMLHESVRLGLMMVLELLTPLERGVFVLHEAFDFSHNEIAEALNITAPHSRQLLRRARRRVDECDETEFVSAEESRDLVESFFAAAKSGDLDQLKRLLSDDVVAVSDGGGRASAALIPLVGADKVSMVFSHLVRQTPGIQWRWVSVNQQPGIVMFDDGLLHSVAMATMQAGRLHRLYITRNPDKLRAIAGMVKPP